MPAKKFDRQKLEGTKIRLVRPGPNAEIFLAKSHVFIGKLIVT